MPPQHQLDPASPLGRLLDAPQRPGTVVWIGIRPARRGPLLPVAAAGMDPETGLDGDHYRSGTSRTRQVTLIQSEHLGAIAGYLGLERVAPERLRRNVVTSGINLLALKGRTFRLGTALLLCTGECHPCSRMEAELGTGGYNAVRGHGGITARVLQAGRVSPGDAIARDDGQA
jgi:MOSC domain-containing protein YiiM